VQKTTLVLGASDNIERYSNIAIKKLVAYNHPVIAVGKKKAVVGDVSIGVELDTKEEIDTITLYLGPKNQLPYYDTILAINPKRIIFNPGTENEELAKLATSKGIEAINACTLVMLATNQY
jgi:uncharacterized protein